MRYHAVNHPSKPEQKEQVQSWVGRGRASSPNSHDPQPSCIRWEYTDRISLHSPYHTSDTRAQPLGREKAAWKNRTSRGAEVICLRTEDPSTRSRAYPSTYLVSIWLTFASELNACSVLLSSSASASSELLRVRSLRSSALTFLSRYSVPEWYIIRASSSSGCPLECTIAFCTAFLLPCRGGRAVQASCDRTVGTCSWNTLVVCSQFYLLEFLGGSWVRYSSVLFVEVSVEDFSEYV